MPMNLFEVCEDLPLSDFQVTYCVWTEHLPAFANEFMLRDLWHFAIEITIWDMDTLDVHWLQVTQEIFGLLGRNAMTVQGNTGLLGLISYSIWNWGPQYFCR